MYHIVQQAADEKNTCVIFNLILTKRNTGLAVAQLVEALRYKSEGREFDSRWHRTVAQRLTQPVTEMSTRSISWGVKAAGA